LPKPSRPTFFPAVHVPNGAYARLLADASLQKRSSAPVLRSRYGPRVRMPVSHHKRSPPIARENGLPSAQDGDSNARNRSRHEAERRNFKGQLKTLSFKLRSTSYAIRARTATCSPTIALQPGCRNRCRLDQERQESGEEYVSLSLADRHSVQRSSTPILVRAAGQDDDDVLAVIWKSDPTDDGQIKLRLRLTP